MKNFLFWLLVSSTSGQASSFQEYCSNASATVKVARGHISNEVSVTERIPKDWAFIDQKLVLDDAFVGVEESRQIDESKDTVCEGKWGVYYWRHVFYKKIRVVRPDGSPFSGNVIGVSPDKSYVEATVICEEFGNSEVMCEDSTAP